MATINIAFDLADDGQARDFRASSVAPELLRVLVDFFIHAADPKSPLGRVVLLDRMGDQLRGYRAAWVLDPEASRDDWARPRRPVTLSIETGVEWAAVQNAAPLLTMTRRTLEMLEDDFARPEHVTRLFRGIAKEVGVWNLLADELQGAGFDVRG